MMVGLRLYYLKLHLHGDAARALGLLAAGSLTGFAALAVGMADSPRSLFRHPGPAMLTAAAVLAWWGAL